MAKIIQRRLAAILTADVVGHGRLLGAGHLAEVPSAVEAVPRAIEIQHTMGERNAYIPKDRRITYRVGDNIGDIIIEGANSYGGGVNIPEPVQVFKVLLAADGTGRAIGASVGGGSTWR